MLLCRLSSRQVGRNAEYAVVEAEKEEVRR